MAGILLGFAPKAAAGPSRDAAAISLLVMVFAICAVLPPRSALLVLLAVAPVISAILDDASVGTASLALADHHVSGQYRPGMAILRASGSTMPANPILIVGGLVSVAAAAFGGATTAPASVSAAVAHAPTAMTFRTAASSRARRAVSSPALAGCSPGAWSRP